MSDYFDFSKPQKEVISDGIYEKLLDIMCWDAYDGESAEDVFIRQSNNLNALPHSDVIDIVHAGGLQQWAERQEVSSAKELNDILFRVMRKTISDPVFNNKKTVDAFPPLANFFYFCQRLDRNGKFAQEAEVTADIAWNGVICKRITQQRANALFSAPDKAKYIQAAKRLRSVYGFTEVDIDKFRYFVCQVRNEGHDPSKNKSLYLWSEKKQTGKTTVGKCIVTIMNGDKLANAHKYESTLATELQFNDHDLPKAAVYECVLLDEAAPKDTGKSYNGFKSKLTNNGCTYNPKHKRIINLKCKRFYCFTSNDLPSKFVKDTEERRLVAVEFRPLVNKISEAEVYEMWLNFCVNCEPERSWMQWYDSFELVKGEASCDADEALNEIILLKDTVFPLQSKTYTTIKQIASLIHRNEPTREQKRAVADVMEKYFESCRSASNQSYFAVSLCREVVETLSQGNTAQEDEAKEDDFPF